MSSYTGCEINDFGRECHRCKKFLPWHNFNIDKNGVQGRKSACKECFVKARKKKAKKTEQVVNTPGCIKDFILYRTHLKRAA